MMSNRSQLMIPDEIVMQKIYMIRGKNVMLDQDLAELYNVKTKRLNEQVKRNINRFPDDFLFQLNKEEFHDLKSQFATSSWGGRRTPPWLLLIFEYLKQLEQEKQFDIDHQNRKKIGYKRNDD